MDVLGELGIPGLDGAEEIGRGGFGVVFRAHQVSVDRTVAVKMLSAVSMSDYARKRFERECKAMAAVSDHPNIVALFDSGIARSGRPYIVMEYVPAGSLAERAPVSWQRAVEVGVKVAGALETAHRIGIFHRDVKPENILLSGYGEPKLADFGVAKVAESSETPSGNITASILHAAPETLSGTRPSAATDVYSLASTIFALIRGRAPFSSDQDEETLAPLITRICTADPPDLRPLGVPDVVCRVLEAGLAKDASARPATPAEFGEQLREAQAAAGVPVAAMLVEGVERAPTAARPSRSAVTMQRDRRDVVPPQRTAEPPEQHAASGQGSDAARDEPRRGRRGVGGLAAAAAVLAVAVVAALVLPGRGDDTSPDTDAVDHSATYSYAAAASSGVAVRRALSVDETGTTVSSASEVSNTGDRETRRTLIEVVPKQLASDVSQVQFTPGYQVVQADPVVRYDLVLQPGAKVTIGWSVTSKKRLTRQQIRAAAVATKREQKALTAQLPSLAERLEFDPAAVLPFPDGKDPAFAAVEDPPLATTPAPSPAGSGTTSAPAGSRTPKPSTGDSTGGGSIVDLPESPDSAPPADKPTSRPPAPAANRAPALAAVSSRTVSERSGVSITLQGSDRDGDRLRYSVSGLPAGVGRSGNRISGTVSSSAVSRTTTFGSIRTKTFTVTATVSDGEATASRSFQLTVRDTHTTMPNFVGKYGCGPSCGEAVNVYAVVTNRAFTCTPTDDNSWHDRIWRQGAAPGTVIAWGNPVSIWYARPAADCGRPAVAKGWP